MSGDWSAVPRVGPSHEPAPARLGAAWGPPERMPVTTASSRPARAGSSLAWTAMILWMTTWAAAILATVFVVFTDGFILVFGAPPDVTGPWFQLITRIGCAVCAAPLLAAAIVTVLGWVRWGTAAAERRAGLGRLVASAVMIAAMLLWYWLASPIWMP